MSTSNILETMKSLRQEVNWDNEEERYEFIYKISNMIIRSVGQLPNIRDVLRPEEIECLLVDSINYRNGRKQSDDFAGQLFITVMVKKFSYKDEPKLDEDGKPLLHRNTPMHHAIMRNSTMCYVDWRVFRLLFTIYDRFDVNYIDEFGFTHFHAACISPNCIDAVEKFLQLGQDPNCLVPETGDSPLHLALLSALTYGQKNVVKLLIRSGADPNLANNDGLTPLHVISAKYGIHFHDDGLAEIFFEISNEKHQTVLVDARDKLGRTPLQLAVANLKPNTVDALLNHGADLSNFIFPTESCFGGPCKMYDPGDFTTPSPTNQLRLASSVLTVIERLEKRGYELDRSGVQTIVAFFSKCKLFEKSVDLEERWYDDEAFVSEAKASMIKPNLSLHDLIQLRPVEARNRLSYKEPYDLENKLLPGKITQCHKAEACAAHLCEIILKKFCWQRALDSFMELTRYQLPILCCEIIIGHLKNEDLSPVLLVIKV
ncbi:unnamed protein product [Trichogramma brassicae]|uniref:Uncharacterized protein n=1 Tax=Trichogramma brassicae TaxID=86971 RepID=A0A6H5I6P1_9HYME|nr:unnamed protein product [Trichogramma brassicae]